MSQLPQKSKIYIRKIEKVTQTSSQNGVKYQMWLAGFTSLKNWNTFPKLHDKKLYKKLIE